MPHTRQKKARAAAQAAAAANGGSKQIAHTKRQQIEDDDGWTHVVELGKGKKTPTVAENEKFHLGDFQLNGVSYITRTIQELEEDLKFYTKLWEESGAEAKLRERLAGKGEEEGRTVVKDVVCLGLGSLQSARREGRRASFTQLAALRTLVSIFGATTVIFQDPQFTPLDIELLTSLSYTVVSDPIAFTKISSQTLVYAIHCYADVYKSVAVGKTRPAMVVGTDVENFGKFNTSEKADEITKSLGELVEGCEALDFPQVRHDFSDTKIYWRRVEGLEGEKEVKEVDGTAEMSASAPVEKVEVKDAEVTAEPDTPAPVEEQDAVKK